MEDTLSKFGSSFQSKAISVLLKDVKFLEQSFDIVKKEFFDSDADRWIIDRILWYYAEYKTAPTLEVFKKELDKVEGPQADVLKKAVPSTLKEALLKADATDIPYVKDELLAFCRNQALKNAILRSADLLKLGDYDKIKTLIDKSMHAGEERDFGHNWKEDFDARIASSARDTIPTDWDAINILMDGGLGAGELGVIIAPSGVGKSWVLSAIGLAAVKQGKKVVHYTFELQDKYTGLRYDSLAVHTEPKKIRELDPDTVKQTIKAITGELAVKYFPARTVTASSLYADIQRRISVGFKPDLIIVDYADLMRSTDRADNRYQEQGLVYEELRSMLGELQIGGWTASQTQRSSLNEDIIEADKIAESYAKIMTADFIMSVSRKVEDKMVNVARGHVIKNRFGEDGITLPAEFNLHTCTINFFDENTPKGAMLKRQMMQSEGVIKARLKEKFIEINRKEDESLILSGDDLG